MKRYGSIIEVKKDKLNEYVSLHKNVWPGVLNMIKQCHIQNYSIYLTKLPDGKYYLFSYFEYVGDYGFPPRYNCKGSKACHLMQSAGSFI